MKLVAQDILSRTHDTSQMEQRAKFADPFGEVQRVKDKCIGFQKLVEKYKEINKRQEETKQRQQIRNEISSESSRESQSSEKALSTNKEGILRYKIGDKEIERIAQLNHQFCLGREACPRQLDALVRCWKHTHTNFKEYGGIPFLLKNEVYEPSTLCLQERRNVENCSGNKVQRYILSSG